MKVEKPKRSSAHIAVNVALVVAFALSIAFSCMPGAGIADKRLFLRVLARGALGLLLVYDSLYLLFTSKWSFLCINATIKQRRVAGVLLGLIGMYGLITAILGYGMNGDPRWNWMQ